MSNPEIEKIEVDVERLVSQFMEVNMVAGIQVFVTTKIGNKCLAYDYGDGNWYARFGHVVEWVEQQKERARQNVRDEDDEP